MLLYVLIFISLFIIYCCLKVYFNYLQVKDIPGASQLLFNGFLKIPFISNYIYFGGFKELNEWSFKIREKGTDLFRITTMSTNMIFINNINQLKDIELKQGHLLRKSKFYDGIKSFFGENILTIADKKEWKRHHKIILPAFSERNNKFLSQVSVHSTDLLLNEKWNCKKLEIHPEKDMTDITLDIIGKVGFNYDFGIYNDNNEFIQSGFKDHHLNSKYHHSFREALYLTINRIILIKLLMPINYSFIEIPVLKLFGVYNAYLDLSSYLDELIEKRKYQNKNDDISDDILSLMVNSNESNELKEEDKLTNEELKANASLFVIAGHETTSTLLTWILYELCLHLDIQEIMREPNNQMPTYNDYCKLKYVNAVIKETLRMHPPFFGISKETKSTIKIDKHSIPKDTTISYNIYGIHHDERYWENPMEFNPNRFLKDNASTEHVFSWIPFSFGLRKCIGFQFSLIESCMIITRLLQFKKFSFQSEDTCKNIKEVQMMTTKPNEQFVMNVESLN